MSKRSQPAFPAQHPNMPGMTLRDYFAGQVVAAMVMDCIATAPEGMSHAQIDANLAKAAYGVADAMLVERDK